MFTGGGGGFGIFESTTNGDVHFVKCHVGEEAVLRATIREDVHINKDDVHFEW